MQITRILPVLALAALACSCGTETSEAPPPPDPAPPPSPTLTNVDPAIGPNVGGFDLTLTGTGFVANDAGENTVTVGGAPATDVAVIDDTTLTCKAPAGVNGPAEVAVTNDNGTGALDGACTYFEPIVVDKVTALPWEPVTFSDVEGTTWDFGDGHPTAKGAMVSHRFCEPGTYTVQVDGGPRFVEIEVAPEPPPSLTFRSNLEFTNASAGMWAHNDLAFVPGISDGVIHVVDVSDPDNPVERSTITDAGGARGIRAWGHWIATAKEFSPNACDIYDVSDPDNPVKIAAIGQGTWAHNVGIWDNLLVLNGIQGQLSDPDVVTFPQPPAANLKVGSSSEGSTRSDGGHEDDDEHGHQHPGQPGVLSLIFYDVSDPTNPVFAGSWDGGVYVHDSTMAGDRVYCASGLDGMHVVDVSDLQTPVVLGQEPLPGYCHNIWPNADGTVLYTSEENTGGHLKIWDASDLDDIQLIDEWMPSGVTPIIHNVVVTGDYAYIAYYKYGLTVIDVSDPTDPVEVYHYDTYEPNDDTGYNGAWMVYPFGDRVFISDVSFGLWVWTKD